MIGLGPGWSAVKAKRLLCEVDVRGHPDEVLLAATQAGGVVPRSDLDYRVWNPTKDLHNYKLVEPGQFVISLRSFQGGIEHSAHRGIVSPAYTVMSLDSDCEAGFFRYLLKSSLVITQLDVLGSGIRQGKNISYQSFGDIEFGVPPAAIQISIADFLDRETGRIDALVEKKRRLIELLEEKRTALISHVVTKGLDPTVPMKNSGIPWLGEIPAHWTVQRLSRVTQCLDGQRIPLSRVERAEMQGPFPYYGASEIVDWIDSYLFDEPLVLLGEDGAQLLNPKFRIAQVVEGKYWVNNHAHVLKLLKGDRTFLAAYLNVFDRVPFITGATRPKLTQDSMNAIPIPTPPEPEQASIAKALGSQEKRINKLGAKLTEQLNLLAEYRQALITAAVTGQLDVEAAAPDPEEALA